MNRIGRNITSLAFSASVILNVSGRTHAQDVCHLSGQVVELLSTIDACVATNEQLVELESVRQEILVPYDDIDCEALEERIAQLELTIPRRSDRWLTTLEEPVPMCEAT